MFYEVFPITSRYYRLGTATLELPDGKTIIYLRRRFLPPSDRFALVVEHTVAAGDRLDNLAAHYLGDPLQFWRLADANEGLQPEELTTEMGRRLRITQPEGLPGV
jgi:nucleoid-associated protein YgaU